MHQYSHQPSLSPPPPFFTPPPPGAVMNARLCNALYRGWECVFYVDHMPPLPRLFLTAMENHGAMVAKFLPVKHVPNRREKPLPSSLSKPPAQPLSLSEPSNLPSLPPHIARRLTRLTLALDPSISRVLLRDVEGRLNGR